MQPGIAILDNSCYGFLEEPPPERAFRRNLRVADLVAYPSEVNLVEATAAPDGIRERLLGTILRIGDGNPLLPWPFTLLKAIGQAILEGRTRFSLGPSGKEWYLEDLAAARALSAEVLAFQQGIEETFSRFHVENRQKLRRRMKESGVREDFSSAREFIERVWTGSDTRRDFAEVTWRGLKLPGDAPVDILERNEAWRLLLDAEGVAIYERGVATAQPKKVQRLDLIQLVFLGGAPRRVVATADKGFLRAANCILEGRYPNARAVDISDLVS